MNKQMTTKNEMIMQEVLPEEKYQLAKDIAARGASDAEFQLLVHMANKYSLDPLAKEIWCIKRNPKDPAIIMTSRDGYLQIAHRSGMFDGIHSEITERDPNTNKPIKAVCEVWRKDMSHSFKAEAYFSEYNGANFIWNKYPSAMLIKVAEVFALKRAFPISGMVTQEEMDMPADNDVITQKEQEEHQQWLEGNEQFDREAQEAIERDNAKEESQLVKDVETEDLPITGEVVEIPEEIVDKAEEFFQNPTPVTESQIKLIYALMKEAYPANDADKLWDRIKLKYKVESKKDLTSVQASETIKMLESVASKLAEAKKEKAEAKK